MFDSLRKKLSGWFSEPGEEKKGKKAKKTKVKPGKNKKDKKAKPAKAEKSKSKFTKKSNKKIIPAKTDTDLEAEYEKESAAQEEEQIEEEIKEDVQETANLETKKEETLEQTTKASQKETPINQQTTDNDNSPKETETPKQSGFFSKLFKKFTGSKLTQEQFDEIFMELELTLLENNVALEVVDKIRENLSKSLLGMEIRKAEIESKIIESLKSSILEVLIEPPNIFDKIKESSPFVILFFGINGTGKTTSIAKLAHLLKKNKISSVLAAADTFRAASIEQLKVHGERLGIPVIHQQYGSDPAAVAFDAIQYAKKHSIKVVLIDTAGRMYTKTNLLKEMEKIIKVSKPNLKIFVGESITGNDVIEQAKTFNESAGIDGMILSKADIDDKAGAILSVSFVTGKPIYFLGTGQEYDDLQIFKKEIVLKNLGLS